jgi:ABC-type polysaccharide/polyol phosphate export permease
MIGRQHNAAPTAAQDAAVLDFPAVRTILPAKRRLRLAELPRDLPVIRVLAARDFKVKYKQSALGPLWLLFQPFALLAGFLIAFRSRSAVGHGIPYMVFALCGLMVWSFFQAAMTIGSASLLTNASLIRFTPCPRIAFPLAGIIASVPSLLVPGAGALVATVITGTLSVRVLLLPFAFVWLFLLTVGMVALACSLAVRFRDIISVVPFLLSLGLFLAPVGYPITGLANWLQLVIDLNPLTGLLEATRWMMLTRFVPSLLSVWVSLFVSVLVVAAGWRVFARLETTMADEI